MEFPQERIQASKEAAKLKTFVCVPRMRGGGIMLTAMKPTVEECADAFVLMAKSPSMTGSSLKIGKSFSEECGSQARGYQLMWIDRCWAVCIRQWVWGENPINFVFLDISYYTGGKEAYKTSLIFPTFYLFNYRVILGDLISTRRTSDYSSDSIRMGFV